MLNFLKFALIFFVLQCITLNGQQHEKETPKAKKDLKSQILECFKNAPDSVYDLELSPTISLYFLIKENRELNLFNIIGENKKLKNYAKEVFDENKIFIAPVLGTKPIRIDVHLIGE